MGQAAGLLQMEIIPVEQFGHGMLREEVGCAAVNSDLPGSRLGAIFADFERQRIGRLDPGAADTLKAVHLVLPGQGQGAGTKHALPRKDGA